MNDIIQMCENTSRPIREVILHWTAGNYDAVFDAYHINIKGDGSYVITCNSFDEVKPHCWRHNQASLGVTLCCAYGAVIYADNGTIKHNGYPPTPEQFDTIAKIAATIIITLGLPLSAVKTHATVANEDGYGWQSGDPDMRWDLLYNEDHIKDLVREYAYDWGCNYI